MANILETIKKARKAGMSDDDILSKIIEANPEKAKTFKKAKERGADASAILNKVVEENKKQEAKPKKESQEKETKDKKEEPEKEKSQGKKKEKTEKEQAKEKKDKKEKKKTKSKTKNKKSFGRRIREKVAAVRNSRFVGELLSATRFLLVGVDISDHSIEVLLLNKKGSITSYGRTVIDEGVVENGEIIDQKKLSESLKETLRSTKPQPLDVPEHTRDKAVRLQTKDHKAIVTLPDSKTYVQLFKFKNKSDLYNKISERVENTIPFDSDELYWDFIDLPSDEGVKILCVAAQRDIVDMYIYFFKSTNVEPVAFEIEGASIGRALLPIKTINKEKKKKESRKVMADGRERMIIDMGARTSILSIFNTDAKLAVSVSLPYGGHYFTKKISEYLDTSKEEAEKIKQNKGFKEGSDIFSEMEKHGEKIVKEIERANNYYNREFDSEVKEIILAGGTALLPDIDKFLNQRVDPEVKIGNPLDKISDQGILDDQKPLLYSNVVGLSLRSLVDDPVNYGINLLPEEVKSQAKRSQKAKHRSVTVAALFIVVAGVLLLAASIYYLIYLPVPAPIQPLQDRIILEMQEEQMDEDIELHDMAIVAEDLEGSANVYDGPGEEQEILGEAESGESYRATGQSAGWVRIEFEDVSGWINSEHLSEIETIEVEEDAEEEIGDETEEVEEVEDEEVDEVIVVEISQNVGPDGLNLREAPTVNSESITTVGAGNIYEIIDEEEGWIMIEAEDQEGWVSDNFVERRDEDVMTGESVEDTIERLME